jgi:hypothetical protein
MMFGPEICVVGKKIVKLSREYLQYLVAFLVIKLLPGKAKLGIIRGGRGRFDQKPFHTSKINPRLLNHPPHPNKAS